MSNIGNIEINGQKLATILVERGLSRQDVSKAMRYNRNYISQAICRNTISGQAADLLGFKFNIPLSEYEAVKPEPVEAAPVAVEEKETPLLDEAALRRATDYFFERLEKVLAEHSMSLLMLEASVDAALSKKGF